MSEDIKIKQMISSYIDGQCSPEEKLQVEDLIINDQNWQRYYKELTLLSKKVQSWDDEELSPDLEQKIHKSLLENTYKEGRPMKLKITALSYGGVGAITAVVVLVLSLQVYTKSNIQIAEISSPTDNISDQYTPATVDKLTSSETGKKTSKYSMTNNYLETKKDVREVKQKMFKAATPTQEIVVEDDAYYAGTQLSATTPQPMAELAYNQPALNVEYEAYSNVAQPNMLTEQQSHSTGARQQRAKVKMEEADRAIDGLVVTTETRIAKKARTHLGHQQQTVQLDDWGPVTSSPYIYPGKHTEPNIGSEEYAHFIENQFQNAKANPLSTFSIDVDTASYSNVRRFLTNNQLPPVDSVRIEEMINYFTYNYPEPKRNQPFSITTQAAVCPWNQNHQLAMIGLNGRTLKENQIPKSNLVFLIDVSGSMNNPNKLPLLKTAFKMMVDQLTPHEHVAIVVYAGAAGMVLDSTSGADKWRLHQAIDNLRAGGSTAGGAGIQLAYKIAQENFISGANNRVILATDGDFNVGVSSNHELVRMIEEKRDKGIFLTILGFGTGNYKDAKMEGIADKGNGNYYYIDNEREARKVLVHELGSTLFTIAKDVKIQVEFNPAQVKAYKLIGYENRLLAKEDFNDDTKDAGELGAGHTVTALYEIIPAHSHEDVGEEDDLIYQKQRLTSSRDLMTVKLRYKNPLGFKSKLIKKSVRANEVASRPLHDFQFVAAVAEFGLLLRNSPLKASASYGHVLNSIMESRGVDQFGYRSELIDLVRKAQQLDHRHPYRHNWHDHEEGSYNPEVFKNGVQFK